MKETLTKQLRQLKRTELTSISLVTISVIPDRGSKTLWCQFWYSVHVDLQPHCLSGLFFYNKLKRLTFVSLITQLRADSSRKLCRPLVLESWVLHDCMTDQSGRIINQKINILPNNNSLDFKNDPSPGCLPNDM